MTAMPQPSLFLSWTATAVLAATSSWSCDAGQPPLTADMPLHFEEHLDVATIEGSEVPADPLQAVEWRFDEPQPDWKPVDPLRPEWVAVEPVRVDDALRIPLNERTSINGSRLFGSIAVELPDWDLDDWAYVEIRARAQAPTQRLGLAFNITEDPPDELLPFHTPGDRTPLIRDGTVQTYRLSLDDPRMRTWEGAWTHLGIWINSEAGAEEATFDLLSVRVLPLESEYAEEGIGVTEVPGGTATGFESLRRAVFTHAPSVFAWPLRVPEGARLDVGLGVLRDDAPVTFRIEATLSDGSVESLLEETYGDREHWGQRSVDLSHLAGETVTLAFEAESDRAGTVALWGAPTLSGSRTTEKPNVIFYVIDGAGAEYMSLYGYNRRTTPNLERLAAEGAVFEHAYSNASWTRPSTASFMTSLQHSVMGGARRGFNVVPEEVATMAQHLHRAGYQTGVFIANPNAGRMSGLEREVDFFREDWEEFSYFGGRGKYKESSRYLHDAFFDWRYMYPATPYWVHFQTTDIHEDFPAPAPFSGLFVGPDQLKTVQEWNRRLSEEGSHGEYSESYEKTGIDRVEFFALWQGLYDEAMAYNDYQIGRLVDRLKASGEWENTLLVVGADHSISAAMDDMGIAIQDSLPPLWNRAMLRPSITRVPLMFVWPGHVKSGQRYSQPVVSMIDVLPTLLDLLDLPRPEVAMGQSLAPVLLGTGDVESRPVILDEFEYDSEAGLMRGLIEVVDGRWGASLEVNPRPAEEGEPERRTLQRRPVPLLLYDLWNDPYCLHSVHEERPDLVEKYTAFLENQWAAHQALAQRFTPGEQVELTPEQLETLRALGYIQ